MTFEEILKEYPVGWKYSDGIPNVQAPISFFGDYTISHRSTYTLSFRPDGYHVGMGTFPTLRDAERAAIVDMACEILSTCACWNQETGAWKEERQLFEHRRAALCTGKLAACDEIQPDRSEATIPPTVLVASSDEFSDYPTAARELAHAAFLAAPLNSCHAFEIYADAEALLREGWLP